MKEHEFTLILTCDPDEAGADALYAVLDGGTVLTTNGVPQVHFLRKAESLEEAIRAAIGEVKSAGFVALRVEMEPKSLLQPS